MRRSLFLLGLLLAMGVSRGVPAEVSRTTDGDDATGGGQEARSGGSVSGNWLVTADFYGTPLFFRMEFKEEGGKLTGKFDGDKLEGTVTGNAIHFVAKDDEGGTEECTATLKDGTISGTVVFTGADNPTHPETHTFTANRAPERKAGAPQRHEFTPTVCYR